MERSVLHDNISKTQCSCLYSLTVLEIATLLDDILNLFSKRKRKKKLKLYPYVRTLLLTLLLLSLQPPIVSS